MKLSACIEMLYTEVDFYDRIALAKKQDLSAIEFWGWSDKDLDRIGTLCQQSQLSISACCVGTKEEALQKAFQEAGMTSAVSPSLFEKMVRESVKMANKYHIPHLIATSGMDNPLLSRAEQHQNLVDCLRAAAPLLEEAGVELVLEPLNTLVNHAGIYLSSSIEAFEMVREVNSPQIKVLFDIYHQQITEGNILSNIRQNSDRIGHFHIADTDGRHEPGTGELNYRTIFAAIEKSGYQGYVGMEFSPTNGTENAVRAVQSLLR